MKPGELCKTLYVVDVYQTSKPTDIQMYGQLCVSSFVIFLNTDDKSGLSRCLSVYGIGYIDTKSFQKVTR